MLEHALANASAFAAPLTGSSGVKVIGMKNKARFARGSLRVTNMPASESGPGIPRRCSLNIAVFDVPSVIPEKS